MSLDYHSDHRRAVPGVVQPHHVDPKEDIPGLFSPAPRDRLVQCFIVKDPTTQAYCLFLQLSKQLSNVTNRGKFIAAAKPGGAMTYSEFLICGDLEDLTEQSVFYYGRLRSNLSRNEYSLWDCREVSRRKSRTSCWPQSSGASKAGSSKVADIWYNMTFGRPQKFECLVHTVRYFESSSDVPKRLDSDSGGDEETMDADILTTNYVRSSKLLRKVSQTLMKSIEAGAGQISKPDLSIDTFLRSVAEPWSSDDSPTDSPTVRKGSPKSPQTLLTNEQGFKSGNSPLNSLTRSSKRMDEAKVTDGVVDSPLQLKTRAYMWDKTCKRYYADFNRGDITGSAKNFQLVAGNHVQAASDKISLQFGQAGPDMYFMDYRYPLTAFEAFGISLSRLF